jgi:hypothetical protein
MKHLAAAALVSLTLALPAHGQVSTREALIARVSALYSADQELDADSPVLLQLFQLIREENQSVPEEQWRVVRGEVAAALHGMYTRQGGVFDALVRGTVVDLSDTELERLAQLMADPVHRKFNRAMASRQGQERMFELTVKAMLGSFGEINQVMRRHGLKEIH